VTIQGRRPGQRPTVPPEVYTPPTVPNPHPEVTTRTSSYIASSELTIVGAQGVIPAAYGRQKLAGQIIYFYSNGYDFWYVIGLARGEDSRYVSGPCDSLVDSFINNNSTSGYPGKINIYWHSGTLTQTVDAHLQSIDFTWNEDMVVRDPSTGLKLFGISYAVVQLINIPFNWPELPNIVFDMKCRRVLDPRTATVAYSENMVLQGYDIVRDPEGKGLSAARINTASINTAANTADETLGSTKRYAGHILNMGGGSADDWVKTWLILIDGIWTFTSNQWFLILDRPATSVATYDDSYASDDDVHGYREDPTERINEVVIKWTDVSNNWTITPARLRTDNVKNGIEEARTATYELSHIHDYAIVQTKLAYLLNRYQFDFKLERTHTAATADRMVGDVVTETVTARGISGQQFRIINREKNQDGSYHDVLLEYQAACYGDVVASAGSKIASTLPDVLAAPPDVTGFTTGSITEELFQTQPGIFTPRARLTWTNPANYPWFDCVELYISVNGGEYRFFNSFAAAPALVDAIMELTTYSFKLIVKNTYGARSTGVIVSKTFLGKTTPPADVPFLYASAIAEQIKLVWQPSADRDITSYEVRRGPVGTTWDQAVRVGTDKAHEMFDKPPVGVWVYLIKAVDYAGNYSTNATTCQIVTSFGGPQAASSVAFDQAFSNNWATLGMVKGDSIVNDASDPLTPWVWEGVKVKQNLSAFMCRSISPATIDSEIAANGYTTLTQWENNLDLPRRKNAPLWAPLNLINGIAFARFYSDHAIASDANGWRNADWRLQIPATRVGLDGPTIVCNALPGFKETEFHPNGDGISYLSEYGFGSDGSGHISSPMHSLQGGVSMHPSILSTTNSPYAQVIVSGAIASFYRYSYQQQEVLVASGDVTTDGSGLAQLVFPIAMPAGQVPSLDYNIINNVNAVLIVNSVSNTQMTIKAVVPSTGAALSGVQIRMKAVDRGLGGSTADWLF
jgi:hypothetical protein